MVEAVSLFPCIRGVCSFGKHVEHPEVSAMSEEVYSRLDYTLEKEGCIFLACVTEKVSFEFDGFGTLHLEERQLIPFEMLQYFTKMDAPREMLRITLPEFTFNLVCVPCSPDFPPQRVFDATTQKVWKIYSIFGLIKETPSGRVLWWKMPKKSLPPCKPLQPRIETRTVRLATISMETFCEDDRTDSVRCEGLYPHVFSMSNTKGRVTLNSAGMMCWCVHRLKAAPDMYCRLVVAENTTLVVKNVGFLILKAGQLLPYGFTRYFRVNILRAKNMKELPLVGKLKLHVLMCNSKKISFKTQGTGIKRDLVRTPTGVWHIGPLRGVAENQIMVARPLNALDSEKVNVPYVFVKCSDFL